MLKLNVGLSKKVGAPNYGSRGASVNLELEVEAGLVNQPDKLQERVRQLFRLARTSVDEELNGGLRFRRTRTQESTEKPENPGDFANIAAFEAVANCRIQSHSVAFALHSVVVDGPKVVEVVGRPFGIRPDRRPSGATPPPRHRPIRCRQSQQLSPRARQAGRPAKIARA